MPDSALKKAPVDAESKEMPVLLGTDEEPEMAEDASKLGVAEAATEGEPGVAELGLLVVAEEDQRVVGERLIPLCEPLCCRQRHKPHTVAECCKSCSDTRTNPS